MYVGLCVVAFHVHVMCVMSTINNLTIRASLSKPHTTVCVVYGQIIVCTNVCQCVVPYLLG